MEQSRAVPLSNQAVNMPNDELLRIVNLLQRRERIQTLKVVAMFLLGLPLLLVGPCTITGIFWLANFLGRTGWQLPWGWVFFGLTVLMVPLLVSIANRGTGDQCVQAMNESEVYVPHRGLIGVPGTFPRMLACATVAANANIIAKGFTDVFAIGAQMVVSGWLQWGTRIALRDVERLRVAGIVQLLWGVDEGVDTTQVLRPQETNQDLFPVLVYLTHHGWIGIRSDGKRIWLSSDARLILEQ